MSDFDNTELGGAELPLSPVAPDSSAGPAVVESKALIPVRPRSGRAALTLEKLSRMKEMYFQYETMDTISVTLQVSVKTVHRQIHRMRSTGLSWAMSRQEQQRISTDSIMSNSGHLLKQASDKSIRLLHIGLQEFHKRAVLDPSSLTLSALKDIAAIAERLEHMNRLDTGKPTSIHSLVSGEPIAKSQTDKILAADPFTNADFSEVEP